MRGTFVSKSGRNTHEAECNPTPGSGPEERQFPNYLSVKLTASRQKYLHNNNIMGMRIDIR